MRLRTAALVLVGLGLTGCASDTFTDAVSCTPGDLRCQADGTVQVCAERGNGWITSACAENQVCIPSQEGHVCKDVVCEPGETFCGGSRVYLYACDSTGTTGCYAESCAVPPTDGVCYQGQCVRTCGEGLKTYLGCEYFAADLDNAFVDCDGVPGGDFCDAANAQYAVVVSNTSATEVANVIVTTGVLSEPPAVSGCAEPGDLPLPDNFVVAGSLPPRGIKIFELPARNINATVKDYLAYRVASNTPISAYQFNPLENVDVFSNDASMLIPTTSVGTEYFAMSRVQFNPNLRGFLTVVAFNHEPTTVAITPTVAMAPGPGVDAIPAGATHTFVLNRFEVLNLEPSGVYVDLTGSHIKADKPVVVYSGHEAGNAPTPFGNCTQQGFCDNSPTTACSTDLQCLGEVPCCADHLEQQLFPVSTWGREYLAVRSYPRGDELDVWRVLAAHDGTEVTVVPDFIEIPVLGRGEWFEFEYGGDFQLVASQPVMLGQFLAGERSRNAGTGDPAFMLTAPTRQLRDSYVFLAPNKYAHDYVSIAVRNTAARLDGKLLTAVAQDKPGLVLVSPIPGTDWTAYRIPIEDGVHTLTCPGTCSVMVHGYDQFVSYGYPGGLNLFECLQDNDCRGSRARCRPGEFVCVECLSDADCPTTAPVCDVSAGACVP